MLRLRHFALAGIAASLPAAAQLSGPTPLAWRWATPVAEPAKGSPLVRGNMVVVAVGGRVYGINKANGNQAWRYPRAESIKGTFNDPLLAGNTVVVPATNNSLYGMALGNGNVLWRYTSEKDAFYGRPVAAGNSVVIAEGPKKVVAVGAQDGNPLWEQPIEIPDGIKGSLTAYRSNVLYFTERNELQSLNAINGRIDWKVRFENVSTTVQPFVMGDQVYVFSGNYLVALQGASGRLQWQRPLTGEFVFGPAANARGVIVMTREGKAHILDSSGRSKFAEPIDLGSSPTSSPISVGDHFLVTTANGVLNLINPEDGSVAWSFVVQPVARGIRDQRTANEQEYAGISAAGEPVMDGKSLFVLAKDGSLLAFNSEFGVDLTGPQIQFGWPSPGAQISGKAPLYFALRVMDATVGVDASNLKILINDQDVEYEFGRDGIAVVRFNEEGPNKPLADGRAIIKVEAEDWLGNKTVSNFTFLIDNKLPPLRAPGAPPAATAGRAGGEQGRGRGGRGGRGGVGGG